MTTRTPDHKPGYIQANTRPDKIFHFYITMIMIILCVIMTFPHLVFASETNPRALVLAAKGSDVTSDPISISEIQEDYFGATDSLKDYWDETSYGKINLMGDVIGWITLNTASDSFCKGPHIDTKLIVDAYDEAARDYGVDIMDYDYVFMVISTAAGPCNTPFATGEDFYSYRNAKTWRKAIHIISAYTYAYSTLKIITEEAGHDLGLRHANKETNGDDVVAPVGQQGTVIYYGDSYDAMGQTLGHYNAYNKSLIGWLEPIQIKRIVDDNFQELTPLTINTAGYKAFKILRGIDSKGRLEYFWIETRAQTGYDALLNADAFGGATFRITHDTRQSYLLDLEGIGYSLHSMDNFIDPYTGIEVYHFGETTNGINLGFLIPDDQVHTDEDGLTDMAEQQYGTQADNEDTDGDGILDGREVCFDGDCSTYNPYPAGSDLNATSDDTDNDGMKDGWELAHYPSYTNPLINDTSEDPDNDGISNLIEHENGSNPGHADSDSDGLSDNMEINQLCTNPIEADSDFDGIPDKWELDFGMDPCNTDDAAIDLDGDGLTGLDEYTHNANPGLADTDGDGLTDNLEVAIKANPTVIDADNDGLTDYEEYMAGTAAYLRDTDGDGHDDTWEIQSGTDPIDSTSMPTGPQPPRIEAITHVYPPTSGTTTIRVSGWKLCIDQCNQAGSANTETLLTLNGNTHSVTAIQSEYLDFDITSADESGTVTISTPGGSAEIELHIYRTPRIDSIFPSSGPPGTLVTITGNDFCHAEPPQWPDECLKETYPNSVTLINRDITDYSMSLKQVTFTIPTDMPTGAGPVTIVNDWIGSGTSSEMFTVTSGGGSAPVNYSGLMTWVRASDTNQGSESLYVSLSSDPTAWLFASNNWGIANISQIAFAADFNGDVELTILPSGYPCTQGCPGTDLVDSMVITSDQPPAPNKIHTIVVQGSLGNIGQAWIGVGTGTEGFNTTSGDAIGIAMAAMGANLDVTYALRDVWVNNQETGLPELQPDWLQDLTVMDPGVTGTGRIAGLKAWTNAADVNQGTEYMFIAMSDNPGEWIYVSNHWGITNIAQVALASRFTGTLALTTSQLDYPCRGCPGAQMADSISITLSGSPSANKVRLINIPDNIVSQDLAWIGVGTGSQGFITTNGDTVGTAMAAMARNLQIDYATRDAWVANETTGLPELQPGWLQRLSVQ